MEDQLFSVFRGDLLTTESSAYLVEDFLGEGTFGKVARCVETATNQKVAVKIIKNHPDLLGSFYRELVMLTCLRTLDPDKCGIVRWMGDFKHGPHTCLVFELLEQSLQDFAWQRADHILPLMQIRPIVEQLASALVHLGTLGIIHGDLKPENIMMTGQDTRVKIIDFGLSILEAEAEPGYDFGTLWYRSPEMMLGLPYNSMVDMWSLGCLAAELFIGSPIYPGHTEYDMWAYIIQLQGQPPDDMLDQGIKTTLCFTTEGSVGDWRLKTQREYEKTVRRTGLKRRQPIQFFISLEDVVKARPGPPIQPNFTDLLERMLHLDCDQRITPCALLEHPFISMWRDIQTDSSFPEPTMVQPCSSSRDPSVDQCCFLELIMAQPYCSFPGPSLDQPHSGYPEPSWDLPQSCPEPIMVQPYRSSPEPSVDQPKCCFPEPIMVQPCSLPVSHTPSVSEEQREAMVNTTDSGRGTASIPTTSYGVATETGEVKPAVADIPLDVTPKKKVKKQGRVKKFFKTVLKSFCCCCCFAHGDLD